MNKVRLKDVNKKIKGKLILDNINLEFEKGKIYGIHGHNGSGKTMLLRTIAGLIKIDSGIIGIFGETLHKDIDFPRSIGVLIENPNFWTDYTGKETLTVLARIKGIISEKEIDNALVRVGLSETDKRTIRKYSLGMKQRLGIAQAIMEKPDIILLDEPTNALDKNGVKQIYSVLKEEKERGALIIIASHNENDLQELCDFKIEMADGNIIL